MHIGDDGEPLDPQPDMVDSMREGETIRVRVAVVDVDGDEVDVPEELSVTLTPAGDADEQGYRLSMHPVAIASGGKSATVELTAAEDQDLGVDDMETLMLDAVVAGKGTADGKSLGSETRTSMGVLSLAIVDTTRKQVEAVTDTVFHEVVYAAKAAGPGDDDRSAPARHSSLTRASLFTAAEGYGQPCGGLRVGERRRGDGHGERAGHGRPRQCHRHRQRHDLGRQEPAADLANVAQVVFPSTSRGPTSR